MSKVILQLLWFCIVTLCDLLKNLAPLSQPIRSKNQKTNRHLLAFVLPRLAPPTCMCFEFWLVHWPEWLLWFWFNDNQLKTALKYRVFLVVIHAVKQAHTPAQQKCSALPNDSLKILQKSHVYITTSIFVWHTFIAITCCLCFSSAFLYRSLRSSFWNRFTSSSYPFSLPS